MNVTAVVVACINALWQGIALTACTALLLAAMRRRNAASACMVWSVTFVVVALLPFVDLALQRSVDLESTRVAANVGPVWEHANSFHRIATLAQHAGSAHAVARLSPAAGRVALGTAAAAFGVRCGPLAIAIWGIAAGMLLLRLARDYAALLALKRDALLLRRGGVEGSVSRSGGRNVRICTSERVRTPCVAGFIHPMVLVPASLAVSLSDEDLGRVVLHEVGHVARFDDWFNLAERVLRALFFFAPALWYAGTRIGFEREIACDDFALASTGDPVRYAECLTNIVERNVLRRTLAGALGFFIGRNQVLDRVVRLLDRRRDGAVKVPHAVPLVAAAALALGLGVLVPLQVPLVSQAQHAPRIAAQSPHVRPLLLALRLPSPARKPTRPTSADGRCPAHVHEKTRIGPLATVAAVVGAALPAAHAALRARAHTRDRHATHLRKRRASVDDANPVEQVAQNGELLGALGRADLHPTTDEVAALQDDGVTAQFVDDVATSGIAKPSVEALEDASEQGVDTQLVAAAAGVFGPSVTLAAVTSLREAGVTSGFLQSMASLRYAHLSVEDAKSLADEGVTPQYVEGINEAGYQDLSTDELLQLHQNGIDPSYLKDLARRGMRGLPVDSLVRMHGSDSDDNS